MQGKSGSELPKRTRTPAFLKNFFPISMQHRDIVTLKSLQDYSQKDREICIRENRILQPGFLASDPVTFFNDMTIVGEGWLTDCCCQSVGAEVMLNIASKLVVEYKVDAKDMNQKAQEVYNLLIKDNPALVQNIENRVHTAMDEWLATHAVDIETKAIERLKKNKIINPTSDQVEAAKRIEIGLKRREFTESIAKEYVIETKLEQACSGIGLTKKTVQDKKENSDISILGAAGSGKSTVLRNMGVNKADYCVLSTDDYRAFAMPETEEFESRDPEGQAFVRSQDFAYLVKERVVKQLQVQEKRPDIICDCVTLDRNMRNFLEESKSKLTSIVTAFSGGTGHMDIAERAHVRAEDPTADPADKFRHVHTTSLYEGHANASSRLFSSIPSFGKTTLYNTNVPRGKNPKVMAEINVDSHTVEVYDFRTMSEFLNKANLNVVAEHPIELIMARRDEKSKDVDSRLITHPSVKAEALLKLAAQPYRVCLSEAPGKDPYLSFAVRQDGKLEFEVNDQSKLEEVLNAKDQGAQILQAALKQMEEAPNLSMRAPESVPGG